MAAVVFLAIGGLFGLLVALTRWPAVHFLPADWFYLALTAHGLDVLLVWIIFFEMAVLYFASAVLLGSRLAGPEVGMGRLLPDAGRCADHQRRRIAGTVERDVHLVRTECAPSRRSTWASSCSRSAR